jgi:hypothetical protein
MEQEIEFANEAGKNAVATAGGVPKNFRQQADMEAFYRFVHENDLRAGARDPRQSSRPARRRQGGEAS